MKNKDLLKQENEKTMQKLSEALRADDEEAAVQALIQFSEGIEQRLTEEYNTVGQNTDATILAQRGIRQLTRRETEYYQTFIEAHKSTNPKQAIANIDKAMPETIIDSVIKDMEEAHPLLSSIDFINAKAVIKMIVNTGSLELATWDVLSTAITKELSGSIDVEDLTIMKLSAFMPMPKDILQFGPVWVDNYVRILLSEAISGALEKSIVKGTGKKQPIGMCKDLKGSVVDGVYSDKTKVILKSFAPTEYCAIIAPLAKKPYGGYRAIGEVILIVNPIDYIATVVPATTVRTMDGTYRNDIFPYPTKTIQSAAIEPGEAVLGMGKQYFMAVGAGESGKMEYSDEYQFLEDNRVYLTKMYGMGKPKDNNSFIYLDISSIAPENLKVEVVREAVVGE